MKTLLVYESLWGNTKKVAQTIAGALGDDATVVEADDAPATSRPTSTCWSWAGRRTRSR